MTFPSRGCRNCKQRRIKCDETQPSCDRCRKAKLSCQGVKKTDGAIFLSENEYAVGRRRRPRGPNLARLGTLEDQSLDAPDLSKPRRDDDGSKSSDSTADLFAVESELQLVQRSSVDWNPLSMPLTLGIPLKDQALTYYSHFYNTRPFQSPEMMDSHLNHAHPSLCYVQPSSLLSLAIFSLSHAFFGRAQRSNVALNAGRRYYASALVRTNAALSHPKEACEDEVLLAAMLLSIYENSIADNTTGDSSNIKILAPKSFAHHDGAISLLYLRQRQGQRKKEGLAIDKFVRRQLLRSLVTRSITIPIWLRDGEAYGEHGYALELDRYIVDIAKLKHQVNIVSTSLECETKAPDLNEPSKLSHLLMQAQTIGDALVAWADHLPEEGWIATHIVRDGEAGEASQRIFDRTVHIYPTLGHGGMWLRYRALRLLVLNAVLELLALSSHDVAPALIAKAESLRQTTLLKIKRLADDMCFALPYMLAFIDTDNLADGGVAFIADPLNERRTALRSTTASFLCWPLTIVTMVKGIPGRHRAYLRDRLLDVSQIVSDGVLEKIAREMKVETEGL